LSEKKTRYVRFYGRGKNEKEKKSSKSEEVARGLLYFCLLTRRGVINMLEQSAEKPLDL